MLRWPKLATSILVTALLGTCIAHAQAVGSKPAGTNEDQLRRSGLAVLEREAGRQKVGFCASAETTAAMNQCFGKELKLTNQNYAAYIADLDGLLRINPDWRLTGVSHGLLEFRLAEAAWRTYREKTCEAIENRDDGASGAPTDFLTCELALTGAHMQELDGIYRSAWHR
jgi:uncharacterized protein YecT (DUF1311 family)